MLAEKTETKTEKHKASGNPSGLLSSRMLALDRLSSGRALLLVSLLAMAAYSNSLGGDFVFDDQEQIVENPLIRSWANLGEAFKTHVWAFRERPEVLRLPVPPPYYRPLFTVLLTVEYHLFGLWPQGWHLTSLLLHILCCIGVYYVLLMLSRSVFLATLTGAIFAVHPVHTESVSWISGVTDPLYAVFFLPSFYFYLRFRNTNRPLHLIASLSLFTVAAFAKETALSLVPLIFLYELVESPAGEAQTRGLKPRLSRAARSAAPYLIASILYVIPRYVVLGGLSWENPRAHKGPLVEMFLTLPLVICRYVGHLIWPVGLSPVYKSGFVTDAGSIEFLGPAVLLAAVGGGLVLFRKRVSRQVWHGLALLFVPLLPVLAIRQFAEEYLVCDRYLYTSVAGWAYLVALGLRAMATGMRNLLRAKGFEGWPMDPVSVLGVALVLALAAAAARENRIWADSYSLWSTAARVTPESWFPYYNVGLALIEEKRLAEALQALDRAGALAPDEPCVFDSLGRVYQQIGDNQSAEINFKRAIDLDPTMFESINNLGTVYFNAGDYSSAETYFASAVKLKPQALAARFNLGLSYARMGRFEESAHEFERVLNSAPDDAETCYQLGEVYKRVGRIADSTETFKRGLAAAKSEALAQKISESLASLRTEERGK